MEYGPVHSVENHPKWCDEKESENDSREGNSYMLHDSHVHCGSGKSAIEKATRRRPLLSNHNCPSTVLIGCNGVFWAYCRQYGSLATGPRQCEIGTRSLDAGDFWLSDHERATAWQVGQCRMEHDWRPAA